jgi:hypothetical protein
LGIHAGYKSKSGRGANRGGREGVLILNATLRHPVDEWGCCELIAVATDEGSMYIVADDPDNVRAGSNLSIGETG